MIIRRSKTANREHSGRSRMTVRRVLLVHYRSPGDQTSNVVDNLTAPLAAADGVECRHLVLRPRAPCPFPWPVLRFFDTVLTVSPYEPGGTPRKSRFRETQIVSILEEADAGRPVREICRKRGISNLGVKLQLGRASPQGCYEWQELDSADDCLGSVRDGQPLRIRTPKARCPTGSASSAESTVARFGTKTRDRPAPGDRSGRLTTPLDAGSYLDTGGYAQVIWQ